MFKIHIISQPEMRLPFSIDDAARAENEFDDSDKQYNNVLLDTRLNNRILDLRVSKVSDWHIC